MEFQYKYKGYLYNFIACNLNTDLDNAFLDFTPKTKTTRVKINKWDYIRLKSFCKAKETTSKMKRKLKEREKTFASYIQELISKISKEFIYLDSEKRNNPIFKWVKDLNKYFSKRRPTNDQQVLGT